MAGRVGKLAGCLAGIVAHLSGILEALLRILFEVQLLQPRLFLIHPAATRADFTITETSQLEMLPRKTHFKLVRHSPAEHLVLAVGQAVGRLPLRPPLGFALVFVFGGLGAAQGALQPARELAGGGDGVGTDADGIAHAGRRDAVDLVAVQRRKRPLGHDGDAERRIRLAKRRPHPVLRALLLLGGMADEVQRGHQRVPGVVGVLRQLPPELAPLFGRVVGVRLLQELLEQLVGVQLAHLALLIFDELLQHHVALRRALPIVDY
mmetsp:Transcript_41220/g.68972  ORF Transcript_41220/g.68972 Transcript_41220/m.68972 type:complete len:264 (-) Transcript_41220:517-1308(-)